jgi:uncharacterized phiE125 gp8 family phage protein
MYGLTVTVQPTEEPITREEAKANLRFPFDTEELRIEALIKAARVYCETVTGRAFCTQTLRLNLDNFPCDMIRLPKAPIQSVTGITYYDTTNQSQTLSSSLYQSDLTSLPARIAPVDGSVWPLTYSRMSAVSVTYVAGYGAASAVPETIKQAMHLLVAHWFVNREAAGDSRVEKVTAMAVKNLLAAEWVGDMTGHFG